ncbi:MAG: c-type cytochrome [Saprospiraceae bacterium]|nr:c-type cytochrome [Saprospiraceae bacterium]
MSCKQVLKILFALVLSQVALSAAPDIELGKTSFKNNCASCHNKNMKDALTGPALAGFVERWAAYPKEDLYKWIRNSQAMINAGHPKATELWAQYKPTVMTAFPNLTDDEIESIVLYVNGVAAGTYPPKSADSVATGTGTPSSGGQASSIWLYLIFGILLALALFLWSLQNDLIYAKKTAEGDPSASKKTIWELLTSKSVISFVLFALVLFGGYATVNNAISLGRQQNYAPEQPIKFSHATHAGLHKIDCNYCHDGARRSKQSVIPPASTCMNCHKAIKNGSKYGTAELTKIYASIGFDPMTDKYISNYESLSNEEIKAIYTKWIGEEYKKVNAVTTLSGDAQTQVDDQWADIESSLTHASKPKVSGPIEWIRIHNLPDHVYFNHSQHVTIGKIECQKCDGKVEEMDLLRQYSPLSMGWCINCHRETDVKFQDNAYYETYKTYHLELKDGTRTSVKVSDIGGLECQKCHY